MAEEGLNPWCDDCWNQIRTNVRYDSIAAATVLPNTVLNHPDFEEAVAEEYDGDPHDAMEDLSPLCCWLAERDGLEAVYDAVDRDTERPADAVDA